MTRLEDVYMASIFVSQRSLENTFTIELLETKCTLWARETIHGVLSLFWLAFIQDRKKNGKTINKQTNVKIACVAGGISRASAFVLVAKP